LSSTEVLEEELPQGSSLSLTFFLIYINDLATQIKAEKALYTDDLVIWLSHENVHSAAQSKLSPKTEHILSKLETESKHRPDSLYHLH
jgi:hypothetical protein